jgi:hypothetical protein
MTVPYASANIIGLYIISFLSLTFLRIIYREHGRRQKTFNYVTVAVALVGLLVSQNRGAFFGLGLLLGLIMLVSQYRRIAIGFGTVSVAAFSFILYVFDGIRSSIMALLIHMLTSGRAWLILGTTRILAEKPLFGVGHGSYSFLINDYYPRELVSKYNPWYYDNVVTEGIGQTPHGFYTAVGGELGFVGVLLVGSLLFISIRTALSQLGRQTTVITSQHHAVVFVGLLSTLFVASFYGAGRDHIVWFYIFLPFVTAELEYGD